MVRKAKVDSNTWLEFEVEVYIPKLQGSFGGFCGLCGNTGVLEVSGRLSPIGIPTPPVEGHCICPNGRALKFIEKKATK
jgi:hypothetical protein